MGLGGNIRGTIFHPFLAIMCNKVKCFYSLLFCSYPPKHTEHHHFPQGKLREFLFERGMRVQKWHRLVMLFHIKRWCLNSVQDYITKYAALAWHKKRMEKDPAALTSITLEKSPLFYRKIITIKHHSLIFMWQKMVQRKILLSLFDKVSLPLLKG